MGMTHETLQCSYCGADASEWDHLRPLVLNKKPTGYISEIHNLVPACGKCNQSKGNKEWLSWILSNAPLSPKTKRVADLTERIEKLKNYERWGKPTELNFEEIVGSENWEKHWKNCEQVQDIMRESQELAEQIKDKVEQAYNVLKNDCTKG